LANNPYLLPISWIIEENEIINNNSEINRNNMKQKVFMRQGILGIFTSCCESFNKFIRKFTNDFNLTIQHYFLTQFVIDNKNITNMVLYETPKKNKKVPPKVNIVYKK
jgi:hypothetical protein